jgi:hypothetical protein
MSYDYDFNTILKSALLKNNCSNKSIDAFNNDCMYAPFTNSVLKCTKMTTMYNDNNDNNDINDCIYAPFTNGVDGNNIESTKIMDNNDNNDATYNYDTLIENKEKNVVSVADVNDAVDSERDVNDAVDNERDVNDAVDNEREVSVAVDNEKKVSVIVDNVSSNFFMQGSMKDNYKIVDNNFKEIAEKMLLDINCNEDTLNKEVVNYEQKDNSGVINNSNIKKIIRMYNDINKKINTLRIEINAIQSLESNLQTIIDNLKINNKTANSSMENKFKNNMNNVIYYNTYFKFIVYLKQQKNILESSIDTEQVNLNAIMYLVMKNKWFEIAPNVYTLFNQHLPY